MKGNQAPLPEPRVMQKRQRGEYEVTWADQMVCVVTWMDRRVVTLASNAFGPLDEHGRLPTKGVYDKGEKKMVHVVKPHIVCMYNTGMGGVDLADQYAANRRQDLKSMKPYRRYVMSLKY